jgi:hypothetical protein
MKSAVGVLDDQGAVAFLLAWQTYGFAVIGATSLFLLGAAMQAGPLIASQPVLTLTDAVTGVVLGVTLYAEQPRTGLWILPALFGFALLTCGVFTLSRTRCLAECLNSEKKAPDQVEKAAVWRRAVECGQPMRRSAIRPSRRRKVMGPVPLYRLLVTLSVTT